MAGLDSLGVEADGVHVLPTSTVSRSLQHVARVADAAVRLVALLIVALVLVVPSVVVLLTALFKADAREYAGLLLDRMIDLFKTILPGHGFQLDHARDRRGAISLGEKTCATKCL